MPYKKAIEVFGTTSQVLKAIEELTELTLELSYFINKEYGDIQKISEEMADVEIMLEQMKHIFGNRELVEEWKVDKLKRLENLIEETNKWRLINGRSN